MSLTKTDLEFIRQRLSGEMMTYQSYAALGKLRDGHETAHNKYLMGLSDRLEETIKAMSNPPVQSP